MKMEKFAEITDKVVKLNKGELGENMQLLDRCIDELEKKKESFSKHKKVSLVLVGQLIIGLIAALLFIPGVTLSDK